LKRALLTFSLFLLIPFSGFSQEESPVINDTTFIYRSVSEAMVNPARVFRLFLVKQKLDSVPVEIFSFTNLRELNMSKNKIEEIPAAIGTLINLQRIDFSNNELVHLPQEIGLLKNLVYLNLNRNVIEDLPPTIGMLENLEVLELWDNELRDVPDEIEQLHNLKLLELRGILFTEEQQKRIDSLVVKSAKLQMSPACACKY
jgi:Leucine-rich repeat (LRR) protein